MADYLPKFAPGQAITLAASGAVTGGRLVAVTGPGEVAHAEAGSAAVVGVAGFDAKETERVTVYRGGVQRLTADGAISAGAPVAAGAEGTVSASGEAHIGLALTTATKEGDVIDVAM